MPLSWLSGGRVVVVGGEEECGSFPISRMVVGFQYDGGGRGVVAVS